MEGRFSRSGVIALILAVAVIGFAALHRGQGLVMAAPQTASTAPPQKFAVVHTPEQWRKILTPDQYSVLREAGTEVPFTGQYWDNHQAGVYRCAACGNLLFSSKTKFDSGPGWPSFWKPISDSSVVIREDDSLGEVRTEVLCARCGGHLGHVFDDGPPPTHQRYCMNSVAMRFTPTK